MAFVQNGISRIQTTGSVGVGAGSVRSVSHYVTNDDAATVQAGGYFDPAANQLVVGDVIMASLDLNGATPQLKIYIVTTNTGTVVTIAPQTT